MFIAAIPGGEGGREHRRRPFLMLLLPILLLLAALICASPILRPVGNLTLDTAHQLGLSGLLGTLYGDDFTPGGAVAEAPRMCGQSCDPAAATSPDASAPATATAIRKS